MPEGVGYNDKKYPEKKSSHTLGMKFSNAGAAGDAQVNSKFSSVGNSCKNQKKTPMKNKGG